MPNEIGEQTYGEAEKWPAAEALAREQEAAAKAAEKAAKDEAAAERKAARGK